VKLAGYTIMAQYWVLRLSDPFPSTGDPRLGPSSFTAGIPEPLG
jgi:hypothetical protein